MSYQRKITLEREGRFPGFFSTPKAGGRIRVMEQRYETIDEIQSALGKRSIQATQAEVESAMDWLGLRGNLGPADLTEIANNLGPKHKVNSRILRKQRILSS